MAEETDAQRVVGEVLAEAIKVTLHWIHEYQFLAVLNVVIETHFDSSCALAEHVYMSHFRPGMLPLLGPY